MKILKNKKIFGIFSAIFFIVAFPMITRAEVNLVPSGDKPSVDLFLSPQTGSFLGGSSFEVPFFVDTKGKSVTSIELNISYDPTKLGITKPSNGKSIIGIWTSAPGYDNNKGTATFSGTIPNGIISESGLITSITFEAKSQGDAWIAIGEDSKVSIFDGVETQAMINTNRGIYTIFPKPQGNINVYSETHPLEDQWSNNNNVSFSWSKVPSIIGYSFLLDNKPNTLPENQVQTTDTIKQYQNLEDGVWYFHIKALSAGDIWGTTTNRVVKIDTAPPNTFEPKVKYTNQGNTNLAIISFNTNDSLSGIDHYEVSITDTSDKGKINNSPVFVYSESPFQVPVDQINSAIVTVRAIDRSGNTIDAQVEVKKVNKLWQFVFNNSVLLLNIIIFILLILYLIHYFRDHKIFKRLKMLDHIIKVEDQKVKIEEEKEEKEEEKIIENISHFDVQK